MYHHNPVDLLFKILHWPLLTLSTKAKLYYLSNLIPHMSPLCASTMLFFFFFSTMLFFLFTHTRLFLASKLLHMLFLLSRTLFLPLHCM